MLTLSRVKRKTIVHNNIETERYINPKLRIDTVYRGIESDIKIKIGDRSGF